MNSIINEQECEPNILRREEGLKSIFVISYLRELQLVNNGELC